MLRKEWLVHGAWALFAAAAFVIGSGRSPEAGAGSGVEAGDSRPLGPARIRDGEAETSRAALVAGRPGSERDGGELSKLFGGYSLEGAGLEALAEQAFRDPNPITRRLAFSRLLEGMTAENALTIREQLVSLDAGDDEWRDFNYAWGALAGREAFDFAAESEERDLRATLTGWSAANPAEALAMLDALPPDLAEQRGRLAESVVAGLADHDLAMATDLAMRMAAEGTGRADRMIRTVANEVLRSGSPAEASLWADSLADGPAKGAAMDRVAGAFVREDPEAAAAWVESYAGDEYAARAVAEVGEEWAERDPQTAVAWLEGLPEGPGQNSGLSSAFGDWEDRDPQAAGEYLMGMPVSPQRDSAIAGFARGYAWQDPQTAIAWAQDIADAGLRQESLTQVGRAYFRRDPDGARAWLETSGLSPEARQQVIEGRR